MNFGRRENNNNLFIQRWALNSRVARKQWNSFAHIFRCLSLTFSNANSTMFAVFGVRLIFPFFLRFLFAPRAVATSVWEFFIGSNGLKQRRPVQMRRLMSNHCSCLADANFNGATPLHRHFTSLHSEIHKHHWLAILVALVQLRFCMELSLFLWCKKIMFDLFYQ